MSGQRPTVGELRDALEDLADDVEVELLLGVEGAGAFNVLRQAQLIIEPGMSTGYPCRPVATVRLLLPVESARAIGSMWRSRP